jgi:hypothetical protein
MPIFIKVMIVLCVICLLRVLIWQNSKTNSLHLQLTEKFGNQMANFVNYVTLLFMGIAAIIITFTFPSAAGLLIAGILGLMGCLIGM